MSSIGQDNYRSIQNEHQNGLCNGLYIYAIFGVRLSMSDVQVINILDSNNASNIEHQCACTYMQEYMTGEYTTVKSTIVSIKCV
jgi:hypothetical protein